MLIVPCVELNYFGVHWRPCTAFWLLAFQGLKYWRRNRKTCSWISRCSQAEEPTGHKVGLQETGHRSEYTEPACNPWTLLWINHHNHTTPNTASTADDLLSKMSTFEFKFMLVFWNSLLKKTYILPISSAISSAKQSFSRLWKSSSDICLHTWIRPDYPTSHCFILSGT